MYTFSREKYRIGMRDFFPYAAGIMLIITGSIIYIWPNIKMLDLNYEFQKLEGERQLLVKQNRLLKIEVESLKSLEYIEKSAVDDGFVLPSQSQLVYIIKK